MTRVTRILLAAFAINSAAALAESTFVGNGGSAGDLDLTVTLAQIRETLMQIKEGER